MARTPGPSRCSGARSRVSMAARSTASARRGRSWSCIPCGSALVARWSCDAARNETGRCVRPLERSPVPLGAVSPAGLGVRSRGHRRVLTVRCTLRRIWAPPGAEARRRPPAARAVSAALGVDPHHARPTEAADHRLGAARTRRHRSITPRSSGVIAPALGALRLELVII